MIDINQILRQSETRAGHTYYSPAHIVTAEAGQIGTPWWMTAGGIPLGQQLAVTVSAPERPHKGHIYHQVQGIQNSTVIGSGAAPTNGIYTGVEDSCS